MVDVSRRQEKEKEEEESIIIGEFEKNCAWSFQILIAFETNFSFFEFKREVHRYVDIGGNINVNAKISNYKISVSSRVPSISFWRRRTSAAS